MVLGPLMSKNPFKWEGESCGFGLNLSSTAICSFYFSFSNRKGRGGKAKPSACSVRLVSPNKDVWGRGLDLCYIAGKRSATQSNSTALQCILIWALGQQWKPMSKKNKGSSSAVFLHKQPPRNTMHFIWDLCNMKTYHDVFAVEVVHFEVIFGLASWLIGTDCCVWVEDQIGSLLGASFSTRPRMGITPKLIGSKIGIMRCATTTKD